MDHFNQLIDQLSKKNSNIQQRKRHHKKQRKKYAQVNGKRNKCLLNCKYWIMIIVIELLLFLSLSTKQIFW